MNRTRRLPVTWALLSAAGVLAHAGAAPSPRAADRGEWRAYGADLANTKYSPLAQITRENVKQLQIAWRRVLPDAALIEKDGSLHPFLNEATPLMVDGALYTITPLGQIVSLDPVDGATRWVYDPKVYAAGQPVNLGFVHRGLAYWSEGRTRRLFAGTVDGYLIALDARTGHPVHDFGDGGRIDLTQGLRRPVDRAHYGVSSAPIVCRGVVVVGSTVLDPTTRKEGAPGDVRGFDARTGKLRWTFNTIPLAGELGHETWENGSAEYTGNTNVWTLMSADESLGHVYLPVSSPTNDWYGGHRPGDNLYSDSLVAVDAESGKRVWHFQMVHHDLWDYDPPAAPVLADITVDGRALKAIAQVTKQGFTFVFDRVTGRPVWPIQERRVPQSRLPGERSSPTQPFPTRPAPFDRQGISEDELIDFTPELRAEARAILSKYEHGPLFTPPAERSTLTLPGWIGGASWAGAAFDPDTGRLYVNSITAPVVATLYKPDPSVGNVDLASRPIVMAEGPRGLPLTKPPYGRFTAIDLNTGSHVWMSPLGSGPRDHPALASLKLPRLGWPVRGVPLLTKTLLFSGQEPRRISGRPSPRGNGVLADFETREPKLWAFDKTTGEVVWEADLPTNATGGPLTYIAGGRQFIVVPIGGANLPSELVAFALPNGN
jgi:quinoprotein glucose dehydrogenase